MKTKITENEIEIIEEDDGIIFITFKTKNIDLEIAKKLVEERHEFTDENNLLVFCDGTITKIVTIEARKYLASKEGFENIKAVAFFCNNTFTYFIVNFIIRVHIKNSEIQTRVKIFNSKQKAIDWLKNQK